LFAGGCAVGCGGGGGGGGGGRAGGGSLNEIDTFFEN